MLKAINQIFFKPVLQYNQENIERINNICFPLKESFGITHFGYWRIFNDGRYVLISNSSGFREVVACYDFSFRSQYCQEIPQYLCPHETYKHIWQDNVEDEAIKMLCEHGAYNIFNIIKENKGTVENYFFATDKDHSLIKDLYEKHSSLLENFITYFHKIGGDLCEASDVSKQGVSPYLRKTYPQIESIFEAITPWERKIIKFNALLNSKVQEEIYEIGKKNDLTPRELQCLAHLSTGKAVKEIARAFSLSPRTIETHIDRIRLKTKLQTKSELIHWFENIFKYFLIKNKDIDNYLITKY